jgi:hypothetical protein
VPVPPVGERDVLDVPSLLSVKPAERSPVVPLNVLTHDAEKLMGPPAFAASRT